MPVRDLAMRVCFFPRTCCSQSVCKSAADPAFLCAEKARSQRCTASRERGLQESAPQALAAISLEEVVKPVQRRACLLGGACISAVLALEQRRHAVADAASEEDLKLAVRAAFAKTAGKAKAPVLLRLVFHDAGTYSREASTGGANASVRFELKRPENAGLNRGWKVIEQTMQALEGTPAAGHVSYADLVALGGAYAVEATGGPRLDVKIGRPDASQEDPEGRLPQETATADELLRIFRDKGFSAQEFVALSGAHTLGNKGFGDPVTFDNEYFKALQRRPWEDKNNSMAAMIGLPSDHVLPDSKPCQGAIQKYASSQDAFFRDFAAAYLKLSSLGTGIEQTPSSA